MQASAPHPRVSFGPYCFDRSLGRLWKGEKPIPLGHRLRQLLALLIERADQVVSPESIRERLWPDVRVVRANVKVAVGDLRRLLGDSARSPLFIRTEGRRGYRFIAPVRHELGVGGLTPAPVDRRLWVLAFQPDARETIFELQMKRADEALGTGHMPAWRDALWSAADLARGLSDPDRLTAAALRLTDAHVSPVQRDDRLIELLTECMDRLERSGSRLHPIVCGRLARALYPDAESDALRLRLAARAARFEPRSPGEAAGSLLDRLNATLGPDHLESRRSDSNLLVDQCRQVDDEKLLLFALGSRIAHSLEAGDGDAFREDCDRYLTLASALDRPWFRWSVTRYRALLRLLVGDHARAEAAIRAGLEVGEPLDHPDVLALFYAQMLALRLQEGRGEELLPALDRFAPISPYPIWRCAHAYTLALAGHRERACALLDELTQSHLQALRRDTFFKSALVLLADTAYELRARQPARSIYAAALPYASHCAVLQGLVVLGSLHRPLARLAHLLGSPRRAHAHFTSAQHIHHQLRATYWIERTDHERQGLLDPPRRQRLLSKSNPQ